MFMQEQNRKISIDKTKANLAKELSQEKLSNSQKAFLKDPLTYARTAIRITNEQLSAARTENKRRKLRAKVAFWVDFETKLVNKMAKRLNDLKEAADKNIADKAQENQTDEQQ